MKIPQVIRTLHIKMFLQKQEEVDVLQTQVDLLRNRLKLLKEDKKSVEQMLLEAMHKGVEVMSKQYALEINTHDEQPYINWRKEFETYYPVKYQEVKGSYERKQWEELIVAKREVA